MHEGLAEYTGFRLSGMTAAQAADFVQRATIPIPAGGTVFPFIHVSDAWGVLDVQAGGLWMANDWQCARIVAPEDLARRPLIGDGWTLHLAEGWEVVSTERPGDWELREPLVASKTGGQIE